MDVSDFLKAISAWPWSMFAAIFGGLSLATLWYIKFFRPGRKNRLLRRPTRTWLLVSSAIQHECQYASQGGEEHTLNELTLPPNSEFIIDLVMKVNVPISYSEIQIGFMGDGDTKPYFTKYMNRYIKVGRGTEIDPSSGDTDDFIDKHLYYHRRGTRTFSARTVLSMAFVIKTRDVGLYPLHLLFISGEPLGEEFHLFVTVEETPSIELVCTESKHKRLSCVIIPIAFERRTCPGDHPACHTGMGEGPAESRRPRSPGGSL
jgi:hypothetical protein